MITRKTLFLLVVLSTALSFNSLAAIITVTTTNNVNPAAGQLSLRQALEQVQAGDEIRFNISGAGPHYIQTPTQGYPFITASNVTINGYSQPGSAPNSNSILAPNNARITIVLDSRQGGHRPMTFDLTTPNDDRGYDASEGAVLGIVGAQGFRVQGLSFLGVPQAPEQAEVALYFVSFARGASGHINGCWLGVDPDGRTVAAAANGVTGFRYRVRNAIGTVTDTILVNDLVIGVAPKAANAVQQFNVIAGMPAIPIIVEGDNTRISGNFITVLPDGLHDYNVALNEDLRGRFEGAIEIGRSGNNTLIGVDGDGVNDENERNIFGGMLPPTKFGYRHLIEFYGQNPGTNIVIAGNYVGVGIDGQTRFTNGVPVLNASGSAAQYRLGSNFDGVSDALEGNLIANNWPPSLFPAAAFAEIPETLSFFSELNSGATVSLRGNSLINNFPFPASPARDGGFFVANYYAKALLDPFAGVTPVLSNSSTRVRLKGWVPVADPFAFSQTIVDVYLADPEGMTNGIAELVSDLPQGFVQGRNYLGSFVEGSGADLDAEPGAFEFDVSRLNLAAGAQVTITANYPGLVSTGEAPDFTAIERINDGTVTLSWPEGTGATLQSAPTVAGPWTDEITVGSSFSLSPIDGTRFFRLQAGSPITGGGAPPLTSPFSNVLVLP